VTALTASAALHDAREVRDQQLPEIAAGILARCVSTEMARLPGFGNTVYARGRERALQAVLDRVGERARAAVAAGWQPTFATLAEIRASDYLLAEGGPG